MEARRAPFRDRNAAPKYSAKKMRERSSVTVSGLLPVSQSHLTWCP